MVKKERNLKDRVWRSTTHRPISLSVASLIYNYLYQIKVYLPCINNGKKKL